MYLETLSTKLLCRKIHVKKRVNININKIKYII